MLKTHVTIIIIFLVLSACSTTGGYSHKSPRTASVPAEEISSPGPIAESPVTPVQASEPLPGIDTGVVTSSAEGTDDLWQRVQSQFVLDRNIQRSSVKAKLAWYARHQDYIDRVVERARPYLFHIVSKLEERNMPLELALLPVVESAYHPFAYSRSHASGIWQFIPGTGKNYGLKQNWWYDGRRDIVAATDAALNYLDKLHKEFDGNWLHALAAYNTGERNVARSIARNRAQGKPIDFWSLRLPRETRGYVPSLLAVAELLANSDKHKVSWQKIDNQPYFEIVAVDKQLDLALAAQLADLSMDEIYTLNPGFNRWATDPDGPHRLLIPVEKSTGFLDKLKNVPQQERISWKRHVIKRGESLGLIANKYHTSVSALKQTNNLRSSLIREGHSLLIPSSKEPLKFYTLSADSRRFRGLKKTPDGKAHVYKVRRGDTLWDIGKSYGVSVKELCAWNGLNARSIIRPGKKLTLYLASAEDKTPKAVPATFQESGKTSYIVRKGDSLWLIARRFDTSVKELRRLNKLGKSGYLRPGQQLIIQGKPNKVTGV